MSLDLLSLLLVFTLSLLSFLLLWVLFFYKDNQCNYPNSYQIIIPLKAFY